MDSSLPSRDPTDGAAPDWRVVVRRTLLVIALAAAAALAALVTFVLLMIPLSPGVKELRALQQAMPSVLQSADGQPLMLFRRTQQERVALAKISPHVVQALLATEDQRFYSHRGVDVYRTLGAAWHTLTGRTQGGSTVTQQLARNLFPEEIGRERTLTRKAKELITALRIERAYSKEQILETYLNSAPFLYNVVGIEMAARTYYDKSAAELDALESATLIGMLKGTRYYNPVLHPERAKERRNVVLAQMQRHGALNAAEVERLRAMPLKVELRRQPDVMGNAPHFAVQVRKWLIEWADEHDYNLYTDGLVVQTTIDSRLQDLALRAVERQMRALQAVADVEWSAPRLRVVSTSPDAYLAAAAKVDPFTHFWKSRRDLLSAFVRESPAFRSAVQRAGSEAAALQALLADRAWLAQLQRDKTRLEAGLVAIDPTSGEVKVWVGSRDFAQDQYDHVALAARQPGSTFKPFVYGAALESGFSPEHVYLDEPIEIALPDGNVWSPTDMTEPTFEPTPLRDGLVYSKNTITAQVAQDVGIARIAALARNMGIESPLDPVPSLALGTSPVTLLEMVTAYSTLAQQGQHHQPVLVKRITDRHGRVLAEFGTQPTRRALSPDAASDLIDMMRGVLQRGTGTQLRARFGVTGDVAGKTGTTQNNTDGWFILMHPTLVSGAWVGFNDQRVTLRSDYWGQGGHNAILLVGDFFRSVQKEGLVNAKAKFPPPAHPQPPPPEPSDAAAIDAAALPVLPTESGERPQPPTAPEVVVQHGEDGIAVGDKASVTTVRRSAEPPKSAAELDRVLRALGRDTGESGGAASSGTGESGGDAASGAYGSPVR